MDSLPITQESVLVKLVPNKIYIDVFFSKQIYEEKLP